MFSGAFRIWKIFKPNNTYINIGKRVSLKYMLLPIPFLGYRSITLNDTLLPDHRGDTFEMGLYLASQNELKDIKDDNINKMIIHGSSPLIIWLMKYYYRVDDAIIEPILTFCRFLKLSIIFIPIILLYPVIFFSYTLPIKGSSDINLREYNSFIWYRLLREALEIAGPSFIKLGQWASSRTDIFSSTMCYELGKLHSSAKVHSLEYTKKTILDSLDAENFEEIFEEFKETPIGCGAIAQVYIGKLSESWLKNKNIKLGLDKNRWCAIKVIHPSVEKQISRDLKLMKFFANTINMIPTMEWLSLPSEVENFSILMNLQLDLRIECLNLSRFNSNFKDNPTIKFPKGFQNLCSRNVLFEEYIHGFPMKLFLEIKDDVDYIDLYKKVSDPFINAFLQMLILDNFVHADLHPGNVMIRFIRTDRYERKIISSEIESFKIVNDLMQMYKVRDSKFFDSLHNVLAEYQPQICFIDTGLVTELNDLNRRNFIALFNALTEFDGHRVGELMIERSKTPDSAINKKIFAQKTDKLISSIRDSTFRLGSISIGALLEQMLGMVRDHHVRMEGDFISVIVAILLLEGIGRQLDPKLDLFERFVSFVLIHGFER